MTNCVHSGNLTWLAGNPAFLDVSPIKHHHLQWISTKESGFIDTFLKKPIRYILYNIIYNNNIIEWANALVPPTPFQGRPLLRYCILLCPGISTVLQCWNADGQELGGSCREGCGGF